MAAANDAEIDILVKSSELSDSQKLVTLKEKQTALRRVRINLIEQSKDLEVQKIEIEMKKQFVMMQQGLFRSGGLVFVFVPYPLLCIITPL